MKEQGNHSAVYETFLIDLYKVFSQRHSELEQRQSKLSEYEEGKLMAYTEMLDAIKTRDEMIAEILTNEEAE